ncbi:MAG: chemotaxis protein MotB [Rhodobacterales bacterium]|nr:chemotaxis protein MotB [Rhodobacterales bacterium]NCT13236.1 chemotaxis protein MotB [Rhodobacterales bacterium]
MVAHANAPIIIKRKKVIAGGGHHGGAWKVAYADFVTAMMAFFMLMWLLNATTEDQRKGISDYFAPTIPISRDSGGGDGLFGGNSMFSQETLLRDGTGATAGEPGPEAFAPGEQNEDGANPPAEVAALREVEEVLQGIGGESAVAEQALRHVVTRLTDEGLVIELFSLPDAPLFAPDTAQPMPVTTELLRMIARTAGLVTNQVAVTGHTPARPVVVANNPVWTLSSERAMQVRLMLEEAGVAPARMQRVTGNADRALVDPNPMAVRNDRIEIILLRKAGANGQ